MQFRLSSKEAWVIRNARRTRHADLSERIDEIKDDPELAPLLAELKGELTACEDIHERLGRHLQGA